MELVSTTIPARYEQANIERRSRLVERQETHYVAQYRIEDELIEDPLARRFEDPLARRFDSALVAVELSLIATSVVRVREV